MRLVICDGNRILSEALAAALEAHDRTVTAVATSGAQECIAAVTLDQPDVCVLDPYGCGAGDGLEIIRTIRDHWPGLAVLVLSDVTDPVIRAQARRLGVAGFVGKNRSVSQIVDVLKAIAADEPAFDPAPPPGAPHRSARFVLTPREEEVLRRIAAGQHTRQMADEMNIAISTLRSYVKNVFAKLGVHSRLEAAAVASRANLLGELPDQPVPPQDQDTLPHPA
jgi:DNA-binding NarL/FixJ family response regulator